MGSISFSGQDLAEIPVSDDNRIAFSSGDYAKSQHMHVYSVDYEKDVSMHESASTTIGDYVKLTCKVDITQSRCMKMLYHPPMHQKNSWLISQARNPTVNPHTKTDSHIYI